MTNVMKKQLMRYKLIADQKVGRANKHEVLNDELLQVEKHMEHVRTSCQSTYKKMSQCLQTHGGGDIEKRLRKLPEKSLANSLSEGSKALLSDSESNKTLGESFRLCSEAQADVATEKALLEMFVDTHVILPMQQLAETEIPNFYKQRERLKRMVLDRDGALQAHQKAHKNQFTPGINLQQATSRTDSAKDDLDQATNKMEQFKDQVITEMFELVTRESEHTERIFDFYTKQLEYHRKCVAILESYESELKSLQDCSLRPCFGRPLHEHLMLTKRDIALPLEACTLCVLALGIKEEGIFRVGGGAGKLKKFKALMDGGMIDLGDYDAQDDIHAVAGALKQYLRELPEPLLTHQLHDEWINAASIKDNDEKLQELWSLVNRLPPENKTNFRYLMKFCSLVAENQEANKMGPSNLSLVIGPNLLWSCVDDISTRMMQSNLISSVIESIITYCDWFFPEEVEFAVTPGATSYHLNRSDSNHNDVKSGANSLQLNHQTTTSSNVISPGHSRNSSSDLALEAGFVNPPGQSQAGKVRKNKGKAPPPPTETPKAAERRTSPPTNQAPGALMPSSNVLGAASKPPVAAKRVSMRRPQAPPPQPPPQSQSKEDLAEEDGPPAPTNGPHTLPRSKPKPPIRKRVSSPGREETAPLNVQLSEAPIEPPIDQVTPDSPPMPDLPPPPLPQEFEVSLGAGLTSELQSTSNDAYVTSEEETDQMTPL